MILLFKIHHYHDEPLGRLTMQPVLNHANHREFTLTDENRRWVHRIKSETCTLIYLEASRKASQMAAFLNIHPDVRPISQWRGSRISRDPSEFFFFLNAKRWATIADVTLKIVRNSDLVTRCAARCGWLTNFKTRWTREWQGARERLGSRVK